MSPPGPEFYRAMERGERERRRADKRNAEAFCKRRFLPMLKKHGVGKFVLDIRRGDLSTCSVVELICDHAERVKATAIVMAPHGKGRVREFFIGSTTKHCLSKSKVSLVVVRPDYKATRKEEEVASASADAVRAASKSGDRCPSGVAEVQTV